MKKSFIYIMVTVFAVVALVLTGCANTTSSIPSNTSSGTAPITTSPASAPTTVPSQTGSSATVSGGNSPAPGQSMSTGKLEVVVTDAPAKADITAILVSLNSIEIHQAGSGDTTPTATPGQTVQGAQETQDQPGDSTGWTTIKIDPNNVFDLLKVKDNPSILSSVPVGIGNYSQVGMDVNNIQVQFAGSDKPVDATVPSGKIKFIQPFKISATDITQLLFDFDAAQSINVTGNGKVMFKPVIKLSVNSKTGGTNDSNSNKGAPNQPALQITTATLPSGTINTAYTNVNLAATGGKTPYTWSISSGALPTGMTLNPATGAISGTPTVSGDFSITVKVTDSSKPDAKTITGALTIHIAPAT